MKEMTTSDTDAQDTKPACDLRDEHDRQFDMYLASDMPAPQDIVAYPDGSYCPAMFHYATEKSSPFEIAKHHGFDMRMMSFNAEVDPDLAEALEKGENILDRWQPQHLPGWELSGMIDTEDGPLAIYLAPVDAPDETKQVAV